MTATEEFQALVDRRNRERADEASTKISWRKATLPGLPPGEADGYVARNADGARAYARPVSGGYEFGRLVGKRLDPVGSASGVRFAKQSAFDLLRRPTHPEEGNMATATPAPTTTTSPSELRSALVEAIRELVPEATAEWNKTDRYETFKIGGGSFALVFKEGARSVSVKIPRQLRDTKVGGGFKKSEYGLRRSLTKRGDVRVVAKAIAAAAEAEQQR